MRSCSQCKEEKDDGEFNPGNHSAKCKSCLAEQGRLYYQANKHKWVERDRIARSQDLEAFKKRSREAQARYRSSPNNTINLRYLKTRYGMTLDDYAKMFDEQKGLCAICKCEPNKKRAGTSVGRFHVDHCHKTGKVRGLLCYHCNTLLGNSKDNITILEQAIAYLRKHLDT